MFIIFSLLAGIIHIYIFAMESLLWGTKKINKTFNMSPEMAEQNRVFAFNQGFYNLFLAIAVIVGSILVKTDHELIGRTLVIYSCFSMVGAALVLLYSNKKLLRAALIQGLPPVLALVLISL